MKKSILVLIASQLLILFQSCTEKENRITPENSIANYRAEIENIRFIGHKGSGDPPRYGYKNHIANSAASILHAIEKTDGSEFDLQLSADTTLWVFHNHEVLTCDSSLVNMAWLHDTEIRSASTCNYHGELIPLSELVAELKKENYTDKTLSLDLKVLQNKEAIERFGGMIPLAEAVINQTKKLEVLSGYSVLAETPNMEYVTYFEEHTPFEIYLLARKRADFEKPIPKGYSADINLFISDSLKIDTTKKLQLWVVNSIGDMLKSFSLEPDYIQSDNIPLVDFVVKTTTDELRPSILIADENFGTSTREEYVSIAEFDLDSLLREVMTELEYSAVDSLKKPLLLVYSCTNNQGQSVFWAADEIGSKKHHYYKFINPKKLRENGGVVLKIYIWNRPQVNFTLQDMRFIKYSFSTHPSNEKTDKIAE